MNKDLRLYNLDRLYEMGNGDKIFVKQIITIFLQNIPANAKELIQACASKENEKIYFIAHKMKASIDLFCIEKLKQEIRNIEEAAKLNTSTDGLTRQVNFVQNIIQNVAKQMGEDFDIQPAI